MRYQLYLIVVLLLGIPSVAKTQSWEPQDARLMSIFAKDVDPDSVLPEYPRPQMVRDRWLNLNGLWEFQTATQNQGSLPDDGWDRSILVPFPVESALSGIKEHHERILYRRTFTVPEDWSGDRVLLHFGAVDYQSEVFVNGTSVGTHKGGYNPFNMDITSELTGSGPQEIAVRVYDPTDNAGYPRGKQSLNPQGIMYTPVTGIWQTVWLEPVPQTSVEDLRITPDIDNGEVNLTVNTSGQADGYTVQAEVKDGDATVQTGTGQPNSTFSIPVPNPKLWSPDHPFLYDLEISLVQNGTTVDHVSSYFGMRKISVKEEHGYKKLYLNNEFLFQMGTLDQGYWPDGLYTAPTDEALKYDLEVTKQLGFNMVRKHLKVEPQRWYYWADRLGLLVWQDMPSPNSYTGDTPPVETEAFERELRRMIKTHWNAPSIIMWVIFNEGQGQHSTGELVQEVEQLDPYRLVNEASGGEHFGYGDIRDIHSYPAPATPDTNIQAKAVGEYGGIGYGIEDHLWEEGFGYVMAESDQEYNTLYDRYADQLTAYKTNDGLSAAVYTQTTDVETEVNGLMTYDRAVVKGDPNQIQESNEKTINRELYLTELLPSSENEPLTWKFTFSRPSDEDWTALNFDTRNWSEGKAGFGTDFTPGSVVRTRWNSSSIWMRREFSLANLSDKIREKLVLYVHHDEDAEIYINGVKAADLEGYTTDYVFVPITEAAKQALNSDGRNVIAVHCSQTEGGQYIDAGISVKSFGEPAQVDKATSYSPPQENRLHQNHPNPFNPSKQTTSFRIDLKNDSHVTLTIYNVQGQKVKLLADRFLEAQSGYTVTFGGADLSSGIYIAQLKTDHNTESVPITLIK